VIHPVLERWTRTRGLGPYSSGVVATITTCRRLSTDPNQYQVTRGISAFLRLYMETSKGEARETYPRHDYYQSNVRIHPVSSYIRCEV